MHFEVRSRVIKTIQSMTEPDTDRNVTRVGRKLRSRCSRSFCLDLVTRDLQARGAGGSPISIILSADSRVPLTPLSHTTLLISQHDPHVVSRDLIANNSRGSSRWIAEREFIVPSVVPRPLRRRMRVKRAAREKSRSQMAGQHFARECGSTSLCATARCH